MSSNLLLSQALEGFYMARRADGYSPHTLQQYDWALTRFLRHMGDKVIEEITINDARRFVVWLQTDYNGGSLSTTSIFHAWKAIRALYKWLGEEFETPNIMMGLKQPEYQEKVVDPFTIEEIEKILKTATTIDHQDKRRKYARRAPMADRNRLMILFLLDSGVRVGELVRLNVGDINIEAAEITIQPFRSSRKSRPRIVYMGKRLQKELWRYLLSRGKNDPLFVSVKDRRLTTDSVKHLLDRIGKRAEIHIHPHKFRHTFAIQFLRNGGDIFTLQRLLGHSTWAMCKRYLALAKADVEQAHRRASPVDNLKL